MDIDRAFKTQLVKEKNITQSNTHAAGGVGGSGGGGVGGLLKSMSSPTVLPSNANARAPNDTLNFTVMQASGRNPLPLSPPPPSLTH